MQLVHDDLAPRPYGREAGRAVPGQGLVMQGAGVQGEPAVLAGEGPEVAEPETEGPKHLFGLHRMPVVGEGHLAPGDEEVRDHQLWGGAIGGRGRQFGQVQRAVRPQDGRDPRPVDGDLVEPGRSGEEREEADVHPQGADLDHGRFRREGDVLDVDREAEGIKADLAEGEALLQLLIRPLDRLGPDDPRDQRVAGDDVGAEEDSDRKACPDPDLQGALEHPSPPPQPGVRPGPHPARSYGA